MESSVISSTTTVVSPARKRQVKNQDNANVPAGYKRCSHCGKIKPLDEFYNNRSQPDGKRHECKCCTSECQKKRNDAQKDNKQEQPKMPFDYARRIKRAHALSFAPDTKECCQCHEVKPMTEFQTCSKNPDHLANICKQCMSDNRKKANELKKQQKEEEAMKQQSKTKNNVQTFEYLPIGTKLCYIHGEQALEAPISSVNIDITANGALISYIVPAGKPNESNRIYANEIGSTVFTNPLDLINYFFEKQNMKYNIIKK